jgi:high-affinity nickel permease
MPQDWLTVLAALTLGFLHALEVDHMIAVTAIVSTRPALASAAGFGLRWGIGHSIAVLVVGGLLVASGLRWPERYDAIGEALVGVMLVGIGIWAIRAARRLHLHAVHEHGGHAHLHVHGPAHPPSHQHPHPHEHPPALHEHALGKGAGITLVGLMHGLAGTSGVVALVPVTLISRTGVALAYLLAFGLGTVAGMILFATVAAFAMRQAAERSLQVGRVITTGVGIGGIGVGVYWIVNAL